MSQELVLQFSENDFIEYVIKERFKRDYLLNILDNYREANTRERMVINIKFKTHNNGVLMFVAGQTEYAMLKVGKTFSQIFKESLNLYTMSKVVCFPINDLDKRHKACVHFQKYTIRTAVRVQCGLSCD